MKSPRFAVVFFDQTGDDYRNEGVEILAVRWGKLRRLSVHCDTERISAWAARHRDVVTGVRPQPAAALP